MIPTLLWILISLQIVMGAFDTLFHHELTERLAWRPSQKQELRLHGIRNLVYSGLFAGLGLLIVKGIFAWLVILVLFVELCITLKDFVEEDKTRKLPASERVTHTLLALNYGAILVLFVPILLDWSAYDTGIEVQTHGVWTYLMMLSAFGVGLFGLRDLGAARRLKDMIPADAARLLRANTTRRSILITGGTGFIGSRLVEALVKNNHQVTVLTREMKTAENLATPVRIVTDLTQIQDDEKFDAIVNLAGQPIAGWLWTKAYKTKMITSRTNMTRAILKLIKRLHHKPECLISGSAIGVYGASAGQAVDETTPIQKDGSFAQELCLTWEAEAKRAEAYDVRTVLLRIGIVLDTSGGSLGQMIIPFEFGLGGPFGAGTHWVSWITRDDLVRLIFACIEDKHLEGPVNAVAPATVRNRTFANALGHALRRPVVFTVPAILLKTALGDLGREIFLGSQNIVPNAMLANGFQFQSPDIKTAFRRLGLTGSSNTGEIGEMKRSI